MIKTASCAVYFNEFGKATSIACVALNEHRRSALGVRPYDVTHVDTVDDDMLAGGFKYWIEEVFAGTQTENLSKELEIAWIFYSYEEKKYIDDLLGGKLKQYSDENKSFVIKEVFAFTNQLHTSIANRVELKNFWSFLYQLKIKHDYKLLTALQQACVIPAVVAEMNSRINCIARY